MPSVPTLKLLKMLFLCSSVVNKCPELPLELFPQPGAAVGAGAEGGGWLRGS